MLKRSDPVITLCYSFVLKVSNKCDPDQWKYGLKQQAHLREALYVLWECNIIMKQCRLVVSSVFCWNSEKECLIKAEEGCAAAMSTFVDVKPFPHYQFQNFTFAAFHTIGTVLVCPLSTTTASVLISLEHVAWNIFRRQLPSVSLAHIILVRARSNYSFCKWRK